MKTQIQKIANKFMLGNIEDLTSLNGGIVNSSFKIKTEKGKFVLQKLSEIFDESVVQDYVDVQRYLRTNGVFVPVLLPSLDGKPFYVNGSLWRAFEYIPNSEESGLSLARTYDVAKTIRRFHDLMKGYNFKPRFKLEGFHDTPRIIKKLDEIYHDSQYNDKIKETQREYDFIMDCAENHKLPNGLESTVIHGDPKQQNFLFQGDHVVAMLDLDTMMKGNELLDWGDGFRAWCQKDGTEFDNEIFNAGLEGYFSEGKPRYGEDMIMKSIGLIAIELSARFLTDAFEGKYFKWNPEKFSSAFEQNLGRCRKQLDYYKTFSREFAKRRHFY